MATSNYYGFTHGGTQYSATPTPGYAQTTPQTGYASVSHVPSQSQSAQSAYNYTTATPQAYSTQQRTTPAYETYQTTQHASLAPATYAYSANPHETASVVATPATPVTTQSYAAYGYTGRPAAAVATYDSTKAYYQTQQAQTVQSTVQHASSHTYKAAPSYNASNYQSSNTRISTVKQLTPSTYNYVSAPATQTTVPANYSTSFSSPAITTAAASFSGSSYDAALYSAASTFAQQQAAQAKPTSVNTVIRTQRWTPGIKKPIGQQGSGVTAFRQPKPRMPAKPQMLHYCDVCKVSCAGPQTFTEHLEGQKHKKKEAASKAEAAASALAKPPNSYKCELCVVTCTGADAYAAHIRGAKHQKVVKLHTRLGKSIPEPVITSGTQKTVVGTAKVNFVGGSLLSTTGTNNSKEPNAENKDDEPAIVPEDPTPDIKPVGQDYIEEIKNDEGKLISFLCKLCDCRFTDPFAKDMHMKGRKHRLQYKKKVDPELFVEMKTTPRQRKLQEEKQKRLQLKEEFRRRREVEMKVMQEEERFFWEERRRFEEEVKYYEWCCRQGHDPRTMPPPPRPPQPYAGPPGSQQPFSSNDRMVTAKHAAIYPSNEELLAVQRIVSNTEKALKLVSDELTKASEVKKEDKQDAKASVKSETIEQKQRILKGVMRVGALAKGLLLKGDLQVELVVLCTEKPTRTILGQVADTLPKFMGSATEKYEILKVMAKASIIVKAVSDPKVAITITLSSPVIREVNLESQGDVLSNPDPPDMLDKQHCLDALAAVRHAKWFQACATTLQPCVMIIRLLRDLCQRIPTWSPLNGWALELLSEKVIRSASQPISPGESIRRILESIAGGMLLPGTPGLRDPCEKEAVDASSQMTDQEREDITASAQHALRLVAFHQMHKVLGMDPLPQPPKQQLDRFNRKRGRDMGAGEGGEEGDGKRDKKESAVKMEVEAGLKVEKK